MRSSVSSRIRCLAGSAALLLAAAAPLPAAPHHAWAPTPPMGWNSWDIFGTSVTEKQVREQAQAMAEHLLPAGYDILTVDIQWYEPDAKGHHYNPRANLSMDAHGRLTPAENRFPSAAGGQGFRPLADFVHAKGLRFGIHIMRGIPKQAVRGNLPVLGADAGARDIALTDSTCPWNPDMFGVDATKPAGQAYYDSIINLYASWGVDYIKVDDISRPYDRVQQAEIEALRRAIDRCGRPIVLSLSPGATPLSAAAHVAEHANLWRITDDFWDRWGLLHAMFERLHAWTPHRRQGAWPDADMIPLGHVEFGRPTRLTPDEQQTLMSLWAIGRSPLIFGGDMTRLDAPTLELLTNPEMLQVNQHSGNNRQLSREKDLIVWTADVPGSADKYVALFNARTPGADIDFALADYASPVIAGEGASQQIEVSVRGGKRLALFVRDAGDGFENDHAVWQDPVLSGPAGERKLISLPWRSASAGWGKPMVNRTCEDQPLIVDGRPAEGVGTHSESVIVYDLPEGCEVFRTRGVLTRGGSVVFGVLVDRAGDATADEQGVGLELAAIGVKGKAKVRDLWARRDLGTVEGVFSRKLAPHASGLYRISPLDAAPAPGNSGGCQPEAYLMAHFTGESPAGEQIYFATSQDGLRWTDLNGSQPVLTSDIGEKGVRDPSLLRLADGSGFVLIATDLRIANGKGWGAATGSGSTSLVLWQSPDLVTWSRPWLVDVASGISGAGCAWAPEAIYDESNGSYFVYWATIVPVDGGRKARIYGSHTRDFRRFSPPRLYIAREGRDIIDTQILATPDCGKRYFRVSCDGQITFETADSLSGPWEHAGNLFFLNYTGRQLEGPILFKFNGRREWCLLMDQYAAGRGYLPFLSANLDDTGGFRVSPPENHDLGASRKRHGSVLPITRAELDALHAKWKK